MTVEMVAWWAFLGLFSVFMLYIAFDIFTDADPDDWWLSRRLHQSTIISGPAYVYVNLLVTGGVISGTVSKVALGVSAALFFLAIIAEILSGSDGGSEGPVQVGVE